jgi:hypothetical protein
MNGKWNRFCAIIVCAEAGSKAAQAAMFYAVDIADGKSSRFDLF